MTTFETQARETIQAAINVGTMYGHHDITEHLLNEYKPGYVTNLTRARLEGLVAELEAMLDNLHQGTLEPALNARIAQIRAEMERM